LEKTLRDVENRNGGRGAEEQDNCKFAVRRIHRKQDKY